MHSFLSRGNAVLTFAVMVLAVICAMASSSDYLNVPSPTAQIKVLNVNWIQKQPSGNDEVSLKLETSADLQSLCTWNTKQIVASMKSDPLRIMISGAHASRKGTQCEYITKKYGLVHIAAGDLLGSLSSDAAQRSPEALLLPVLKDAATNHYITTINQTTPIKLVVDIGGRFLSDNGSIYRSAHISTAGVLAEEILSMQSTDGSHPGPPVEGRPFIFYYSPTTRLPVIPHGAQGIAGLGRTRTALPSQVAAAFSLPRKFAICLSSSTSSNGAIFFGDGPYVFHPRVDASTSLINTPLLINPVSTSGEYFIGVKSIEVNGKTVALNSTLLSGAKISSIDPYTTLEGSIYKAVTDAFIKENNLTRVAAVAPFGSCFSSKNVASTRLGPAVSEIDLVLQSESVYWRILGANSVVAVNKDVMCLAFLDGGLNPTSSVVIGGYQLENNLLQFDLAASKLGFSSSLLLRNTRCSNFNFTS